MKTATHSTIICGRTEPLTPEEAQRYRELRHMQEEARQRNRQEAAEADQRARDKRAAMLAQRIAAAAAHVSAADDAAALEEADEPAPCEPTPPAVTHPAAGSRKSAKRTSAAEPPMANKPARTAPAKPPTESTPPAKTTPSRRPARAQEQPANTETARGPQKAPATTKAVGRPDKKATAAKRKRRMPPPDATAAPKRNVIRKPSRTEPPGEPRPPTALAKASEQFQFDRRIMQCTPSTLKGYHFDLRAFVDWLEDQGVTRPEDITSQHIRLYLNDIFERHLSPWTAHHHARVIRVFCNFLVDQEIIGKSPMAKVAMPRLPKELLPPYTVDEVERLIEAAEDGELPERDLAILLALLDTGCRASEFLALVISDVDLDSGRVLVRQGKGRKDRVTFLGQRALKALRKYLKGRRRPKPDDRIWLTESGTPLRISGLRQLLNRLGKRAGVPDVHPHKFRRTFAIWSLRAGMNIYCLQALMGHSDLKVLQRYLALVEMDLETAHREHGAVDWLFRQDE